MPLGIDTDVFRPLDIPRRESVLSIGRIAPSKRLEILIDAIASLARDGLQLKAHVYGDASSQDARYEADLKKSVQEKRIEHLVQFHPAVRNSDTPALYSAHDIFVNCSKSGMYDKTIFEALACGVLSVAASEDYAKITDPHLFFDGTEAGLAARLKELNLLATEDRLRLQKEGKIIAENNSLKELGRRLAEEVQ